MIRCSSGSAWWRSSRPGAARDLQVGHADDADEHCIENLPERSDDALVVPIPDLAHRVLAIYWRQVRPFEGHELVQRPHSREARIIDRDQRLRAQAASAIRPVGRHCGHAGPQAYERAIDEIVMPGAAAVASAAEAPRVGERPVPVRRFVSARTYRGRHYVPRRCDRAETWRCARSRATGRAAQAGVGDHVGRGCASDEQVPRRRGPRCRGASVRSGAHRIVGRPGAVQGCLRAALLLLRHSSAGE